jgi:phosphopentomutase
MLNVLKDAGLDVISVGKINDIFAGSGISESNVTSSNTDGMNKTMEIAKRNFNGLCFVNLVDFDSKYGHRNDIAGYAKAMSEFDLWLSGFLPTLRQTDVLIITADHGCDPSTPSTDHSREYTPMLIYGDKIKSGINLGTRDTFADIGATVCEILGQRANKISGKSFFDKVKI